MNEFIYALVSVLVVSLVSFVGVVALSLKADRLKKILLPLVSFSAGALLGDVFIHLLPEVFDKAGFGLNIGGFVLLGIGFSFIVEKFVHWRHCHVLTSDKHPHPFATMNLVGDGVHNFIDGLIIGASYLVSFPVGVATTIAVFLHEIPQEIGDFGVLIHGGFTRGKALMMNFLIALTSIVGVMIVFVLGKIDGLELFLVPFAAGTFLYIAGSDLIPELHKEVGLKSAFWQFLCLLFGVAVMYSLVFIG